MCSPPRAPREPLRPTVAWPSHQEGRSPRKLIPSPPSGGGAARGLNYTTEEGEGLQAQQPGTLQVTGSAFGPKASSGENGTEGRATAWQSAPTQRHTRPYPPARPLL